jgi:DNA modification methylase
MGIEVPQIGEVETPTAEDDDYEQPVEIEAVQTKIKFGDIITIGKHRLMCGDSTSQADVDRLMDGQKADMVLTDPPYGISKEGIANDNLKGDEFYQFSSDFIKTIPRSENMGCVCYHSTRTFYHTLNAFIDNGWKFEKMLFFYRPDKMPVHTWNGWMMTSQAIMLFSVGCPVYDKIKPAQQDVYIVTSKALTENTVPHPTVKPIGNISNLLIHYKAKIVYDPFLGSGSTMVACHQLNRTCYGMEISPQYCQVVVDRMKKLDPEISVAINGQPYE